MLRQYLESTTVKALKWDAEFYSVSRSGNKAELVQRLLSEDALLSAPTTPWASEGAGVDEEQTEDESDVEDAAEMPEPDAEFALAAPRSAPAGSVEEAAGVFEEQWLKTTPGERGSKALAERLAANPLLRDGAVLALKRRIFAPGSWKTHRSRVRTSVRILAKAGIVSPFPLNVGAAEILFGVLKAARYRSAATYVNAVRVEAFLRGFPADVELLEWCRRLSRAAARGRGQPKHSEPITADLLERLVDACLEEARHADSLSVADDAVARADAYVLAWTFGLRVDEVVTFDAEPTRVWVGQEGDAVALNISMSKTNPERKDAWRTAGCSCQAQGRTAVARARRAKTCAVHRLVHRMENGHVGAATPLVGRSGAKGVVVCVPKRWKKAELLRALRRDLESAGVRIRDPDGMERYGTHAFRRGAAQAMARAGWSESTIKAYLRWESGCVALYIAEAPLALSRGFAASLWGKPGAALCQSGVQGSLAGIDLACDEKASARGRKRCRRPTAPEAPPVGTEGEPDPFEAFAEHLREETTVVPEQLDWLDCASAALEEDALGDGDELLPLAEEEGVPLAAPYRRVKDSWQDWADERRDEGLLRDFGKVESAEDKEQFATRWWEPTNRRRTGLGRPRSSRRRMPAWEDLGQAGVAMEAEWRAAAQRREGVLGRRAAEEALARAAYAAYDPLLVSGPDPLLTPAPDPLLFAARDPLTGAYRSF